MKKKRDESAEPESYQDWLDALTEADDDELPSLYESGGYSDESDEDDDIPLYDDYGEESQP